MDDDDGHGHSEIQSFIKRAVLDLRCIELFLAVSARSSFPSHPGRPGLELQPQPYLASHLSTRLLAHVGGTSYMVTSILRPTIYIPVPEEVGRIGSSMCLPVSWPVSGLVHELIYYYLTRVDPTWELR
ncbi:hypothetical protein LguiB_030224 [Lonicera macranthoides]